MSSGVKFYELRPGDLLRPTSGVDAALDRVLFQFTGVQLQQIGGQNPGSLRSANPVNMNESWKLYYFEQGSILRPKDSTAISMLVEVESFVASQRMYWLRGVYLDEGRWECPYRFAHQLFEFHEKKKPALEGVWKYAIEARLIFKGLSERFAYVVRHYDSSRSVPCYALDRIIVSPHATPAELSQRIGPIYIPRKVVEDVMEET